MADRTQEEREEVDAKRRASQERARARRKEKKEAATKEAKAEVKSAKKASASKSSAPEKSMRPKPRPENKTSAPEKSPKPKARPERKTEDKKPSQARPRTDAEESVRRRTPRVGRKEGVGAADVVPLAAAAGAARRGGARAPTGTGRPMIGQRPIPFDFGVSRSTEIIPSRNPRGGSMYMLNPGGGPGRLGGPLQRTDRPRLMNKGGLVKANCGASMKPNGARKK